VAKVVRVVMEETVILGQLPIKMVKLNVIVIQVVLMVEKDLKVEMVKMVIMD